MPQSNDKFAQREQDLSNVGINDLGGSLPQELSGWANKKKNRSSGGIAREIKFADSDKSAAEAERQTIGRVFKDDRINLQQREQIAKSILDGDYKSVVRDGNKNNNNANRGKDDGLREVFDRDLTRGIAQLNRHRMQKPSFLVAVAKPAPIRFADPSMLLEHEISKKVNQTASKRIYTWAGQIIKESDRPVTIVKSNYEQLVQEKWLREKKKMLLQSKYEFVAKFKAESKFKMELAKAAKRTALSQSEEKNEMIHNVVTFRTKLREFLEARKDPMTGNILRFVDNKVAQDILEKYRGFTMTIDAVVGLIGQTLGA